MKKFFIYAADKPDEPYSELEVSDNPSPGNNVFAVIESPELESSMEYVLRTIRWARDQEDGTPVNGCSRSARVLCSEVCDALLRLVRVPFVCRKTIDTDFADDGDGAAYRHGVKSATIAYTPSSEPLA